MLSVNELEDRLIDLAFAEDIGDGDHTTLCCIPEDAMGKSHLLIKEDGILAGVEVAKRVFAKFDPTMQVEVLINDGTPVKKGDIAMVVTAKVRSLLQTERLMLNIMQRMSGIATMTNKYVNERGEFVGKDNWREKPYFDWLAEDIVKTTVKEEIEKYVNENREEFAEVIRKQLKSADFIKSITTSFLQAVVKNTESEWKMPISISFEKPKEDSY